MEGFDTDWIYSGNKHDVTYTNLDPGEYTFRVKGSNSDVIWNEQGAAVRIIITPPWWQTNLAYILYVIFFVLIFSTIWRFQTNRLRMKHQLEIKDLNAKKLEELDTLKSHFFANISHEFRTPLTLILGPVKQMLSGKFVGNVSEQYRMIIRNGERLLQLINQLLDLSKLESGRMSLQVKKTEISKFIKTLVLSFCSLAESKRINLRYNHEDESILGYVDHDKLEKIINNLLSNAFKFTPEGGEIVVCVKNPLYSPFTKGGGINIHPPLYPLDRGEIISSPFEKGGQRGIIIKVTNTSPYITPDRLEKMFDRFYSAPLDKTTFKDPETKDQYPMGQANTTYKKDPAPWDTENNVKSNNAYRTYPMGEQGSGIGLALTKELVELHHGTIDVKCNVSNNHPPQSPFDSGEEFDTTFTVQLPIGKEYFNEEEIIEQSSLAKLIDHSPHRITSIQHPETSIPKKSGSPPRFGQHPVSRNQKPVSSILIVDDNPDVTSYISSFLKTEYQILTAEDGKIGWQKTLQKYPDLIISDVMMPEMDGFELCKKIKMDERTSHIPVILLTARADIESRIEGFEFGADDYISKPFEADELKVRSRSLIEQRRKLREKFAKIPDVQPVDIAASSKDEQFLKRFMAVFESHISESDFSTAKIAKGVGMSRSNLNRKLRALTNQSTHEFIRTLRLKHAAQLLNKSVGSVADIAYQVGFNNTSHFAKAFREQFGQSPSAFSLKNK
jgi:signal transduction histidine kinase/CheY-like chemotaxis protein